MASAPPSAPASPAPVAESSAQSPINDNDNDIQVDDTVNPETTTTTNGSPETEPIENTSQAMEPAPEVTKPEEDTTTTAAQPDPIEPRIPAKKDATLREFLGKMDDYAPIIPDAITAHYLTLAGLPPPPETPLPLARLLALATQKFIADIAADSYQYARIRTGHTTSNTAAANAASLAGMPGGVGVPGLSAQAAAEAGKKEGKGAGLGVQRAGYGGGGAGGAGQGRTVLTMEDVGCAVGEYGVNVKRGEFYR